MEEDYVLNHLKDEYSENVVYAVCVDSNVVGMVIASQIKEVAKFIREKWGKEPLFYHDCSFGWVNDAEGNRYEILD